MSNTQMTVPHISINHIARMQRHVSAVEKTLPTLAIRQVAFGYMAGLLYPIGLTVAWEIHDGVYQWIVRRLREDEYYD